MRGTMSVSIVRTLVAVQILMGAPNLSSADDWVCPMKERLSCPSSRSSIGSAWLQIPYATSRSNIDVNTWRDRNIAIDLLPQLWDILFENVETAADRP